MAEVGNLLICVPNRKNFDLEEYSSVPSFDTGARNARRHSLSCFVPSRSNFSRLKITTIVSGSAL